MIMTAIFVARMATLAWSVYVMLTGVIHPVEAYQAGAVQATVDGFWWPVIRDGLQAGLFAVVAMYFPQLRAWLAKLKEILPDNKPQTAGELLQQLADAAVKEAIANAQEETRLMLLRLKGETIPPFTPVTTAKDALELAKSRIAAAT